MAGVFAVLTTIYARNGCSYNRGDDQIEAIAQARAIARFNIYNGSVHVGDRPGTRSSGTGISPDIQWEVVTKRPSPSPTSTPGWVYPRADIVMYNSATPVPQTAADTPQQPSAEIIEVKGYWHDSPTEARAQAQAYANDFVRGGVDAGLHVFGDSNAYEDEFNVDRSSEPIQATCGPDEIAIEKFEAKSVPNVDGVIMVSSRGTFCVPQETPDNPPSPTPTSTPTTTSSPTSTPSPTASPTEGSKEKDFSDCMKDASDIAVGASTWTGQLASSIAAPLLDKAPVPVSPGPVPEIPAPEPGPGGVAASALYYGSAVALGTIAGVSIACALKPSVFGDPHLRTLDGMSYDLQAVGEFHLLRDSSTGLDIQARYTPWGDFISLLDAVAINAGDQSVEFDRDGAVLIDGEPADVSDGGLRLEDGSLLFRSGTKRLLALNDANTLVLFDSGSLSVRLGGDEQVQGLLGDNDGNPRNDLKLSDGTPVTTPSPGEINGPFADSWRVTGDDSLFTYAAGQSTATFTDKSFPTNVVKISDYAAPDIEAANATCRSKAVQAGPAFEDCVYDILITGDARYADAAAAVKGELYDPLSKGFDSTGKLVEDFTSPVATNFAFDSYLDDPATSRAAGPVFDAKPYAFSLLDVPRHASLTVDLRLIAYGPVDTDALAQSAAISVDDRPAVHVGLEAQTPSIDGAGSVSFVRSGETAEGKPFSVYDVTVPADHFGTALKVAVTPSNFRGVLDTALGVNSVSLQLATAPADTLDTSLPLHVSDGTVNGTPTAGAGSLETTAGEDDYRFHVGAGQRTLELTMNGCHTGSQVGDTIATLVGPDGKVVPADRPGCGDRAYTGLSEGDYTLRVWAPGPARTYQLSLADPPPAQTFDYQLGQEVAAGSVGGEATAGAGRLESAASTDRYAFTVASPVTLMLTSASSGSGACAGAVLRRVADADGTATSTDLGPVCSRGIYRLNAGGYEVVFSGLASRNEGDFDFKSWLMSDGTPTVTTTTTDGAAVDFAGTPGQDKTVTFEATAGGRYRVSIPWTSYSDGNLRMRIYAPDGTLVTDQEAGHGAIWEWTGPGGQAFVDPAESGTYRVVLDPRDDLAGATSVAVQDVSDKVVTLDATQLATGADLSFTNLPRQNVEYRFTAGEGDRFHISVPFSPFSDGNLRMRIYAPDGSLVTDREAGHGAIWEWTGPGGMYDLADTQAGTYRVVFDPQGDRTGELTTRVAQIADVERTLDSAAVHNGTSGAGVTDHLDPYQNAVYSFSASAGQRLRVWLPNTQFLTDRERMRVIAPDGTVVVDDTSAGYTLWFYSSGAGADHEFVADQSGLYRVVLDPVGDWSGSNTLQVQDTSDVDRELPVDGSTTTINGGLPGDYHFADTGGHRIRISAANGNLGWINGVRMQVVAPDGTLVFDQGVGDATERHVTVTTTSPGTYHVRVIPVQRWTGVSFDLTATVIADVLTDLPTDGSATRLTLAGHNVIGTFHADQGRRLHLWSTDPTIGDDNTIRVVAPDGTVVYRAATGRYWWGGILAADFMIDDTQEGTYRVVDEAPAEGTGTIDLHLQDVSDIVQAVTPSALAAGTAIPVSLLAQQNGTYTVNTRAGQRLHIWESDPTIAWDDNVMRVIAPDGTVIYEANSGRRWWGDFTLAAFTVDNTQAGTYRIVADPVGNTTGSINLHVQDATDVVAPAVTDGTAMPVSLVAQQNGTYTVAAREGQRLQVWESDTSLPWDDNVMRVIAPDGTVIYEANSGRRWWGDLQLAYFEVGSTQAGTYRIVADPAGDTSGPLNLHVRLRGGPLEGNADAYESAVQQDQPTAFWPLRATDSWLDTVTGGPTMTGDNAPSTGQTGPFTGAGSVAMDETQSQRLTTNAPFSSVNASTTEFWYRGTDSVGQFASSRVVGDPTQRSLSMWLNLAPVGNQPDPGGVGYGTDGDNHWHGAATQGEILNDGRWHHVAMVLDATSGQTVTADTLTVYVDGQRAAQRTSDYDGGVPRATAPLNAGNWYFGAALTGNLSNIALYDHALTATQVAAHYSAASNPHAVKTPTDGTPITLTATGGHPATLPFDAEAGHRYRISVPTSTLPGLTDQELKVYNSDGVMLSDDWAPPGYARTFNTQAGTYRVVLDSGGNTGTSTITITDSTDRTGTLSTDGHATTVNLVPQQAVHLDFSAVAGHRYRISVPSSDLDYHDQALRVTDPNGDVVLDSWGGADAVAYLQASQTGVYELTLDPYNDSFGTSTLRVKDKSVDDTPIVVPTDDTVAPVAFDPDTNPRLEFSSEAGHRYRITMPAASLAGPYDQELKVFAPDGTMIIDDWSYQGWIRYIETAQAGTYRIVLDPAENTGTAAVRVKDISDLHATVDTATPTTVTLEARQAAQLTFNATAGERYTITTASNDLTSHDQAMRVTAPNGTVLYDAWGGDANQWSFDANQTGIYQITLDPYNDDAGTTTIGIATRSGP